MTTPRFTRRQKAPEGECPYCDRERREEARRKHAGGSGVPFHPAHDASPSCQSGGYNHCTCDTCF